MLPLKLPLMQLWPMCMLTPAPPLPENMFKQAQTLILLPKKWRRILSQMIYNTLMCDCVIVEDTMEHIIKLYDLKDHKSHSLFICQPPTHIEKIITLVLSSKKKRQTISFACSAEATMVCSISHTAVIFWNMHGNDTYPG